MKYFPEYTLQYSFNNEPFFIRLILNAFLRIDALRFFSYHGKIVSLPFIQPIIDAYLILISWLASQDQIVVSSLFVDWSKHQQQRNRREADAAFFIEKTVAAILIKTAYSFDSKPFLSILDCLSDRYSKDRLAFDSDLKDFIPKFISKFHLNYDNEIKTNEIYLESSTITTDLTLRWLFEEIAEYLSAIDSVERTDAILDIIGIIVTYLSSITFSSMDSKQMNQYLFNLNIKDVDSSIFSKTFNPSIIVPSTIAEISRARAVLASKKSLSQTKEDLIIKEFCHGDSTLQFKSIFTNSQNICNIEELK